jgi:hypothetical protein
MRELLGYVLALALLVGPASAQVALHCCIPAPLTAADIAQRNAFERDQLTSPECQVMHIGCPEDTFTQPPPEGGYSNNLTERQVKLLQGK